MIYNHAIVPLAIARDTDLRGPQHRDTPTWCALACDFAELIRKIDFIIRSLVEGGGVSIFGGTFPIGPFLFLGLLRSMTLKGGHIKAGRSDMNTRRTWPPRVVFGVLRGKPVLHFKTRCLGHLARSCSDWLEVWTIRRPTRNIPGRVRDTIRNFSPPKQGTPHLAKDHCGRVILVPFSVFYGV